MGLERQLPPSHHAKQSATDLNYEEQYRIRGSSALQEGQCDSWGRAPGGRA